MRDILFLAHRVPFPPDRGDRIRSFHVLKHLAARARVHLVAFADDAAGPAPELRAACASVTVVQRVKSRARALVEALASGRPISLTAFADARIAAAVARVRAAHPGAATYVFSGQMAQYVDAPDVMDFVDVDSAKFAAFAGDARGPMRWLMWREARLLAAFERAVAARSGVSAFVSAPEAALFAGPRATAIENGIDTMRFDPGADFPTVRAERSRSTTPGAMPFDFAQGERVGEARVPLIVFTGQMDYRPNVDAVVAFVRDALPVIRRRHPDARFAIVGRAPTAAVSALAKVDGVIVTGAVDDVRGWLAAADVCVAPLLLARGVQNKVLEAMAMARPVVASSAAAEGIDHGGWLRVADEPADAVCALLDDPFAAKRLGEGARAQVMRRYAWDARLAPLDALLGLDRARAA